MGRPPQLERTVMVDIPQGYELLLERPLYGALALRQTDGNPQCDSDLWFDWDGEMRGYTHTVKRQK